LVVCSNIPGKKLNRVFLNLSGNQAFLTKGTPRPLGKEGKTRKGKSGTTEVTSTKNCFVVPRRRSTCSKRPNGALGGHGPPGYPKTENWKKKTKDWVSPPKTPSPSGRWDPSRLGKHPKRATAATPWGTRLGAVHSPRPAQSRDESFGGPKKKLAETSPARNFSKLLLF